MNRSAFPAVLGEQAEGLIGLGRLDEAAALFDHALGRVTERSLRDNLFDSAVTAFRSGQQLTTALTFLNRLLQEIDREAGASPYPHLLYTAAELHSELGDHELALRTVDLLLTHPQGGEGSHRLKGEVPARAGRTHEAVQAHQELLRLDPQIPGRAGRPRQPSTPQTGLVCTVPRP
ncbi:tetratricopeptide repeat protein [Deinococcus oregonensis]|uniref:Tetratricopeptide repeat protein n=1 Tax=Deinococcus oregonensis TaxID=1805970 RepID=A0ABV6B5S8_9DEIO